MCAQGVAFCSLAGGLATNTFTPGASSSVAHLRAALRWCRDGREMAQQGGGCDLRAADSARCLWPARLLL